MSDFFGRLKSGAGKVAFEAEKVTRVNRAQSELSGLKKQVEGLNAKLGEMVYQSFTSGGEAPDIASLCQNITDMKAQVTAKEAEIQRINAEVYSTAPAPATAAPVVAASVPVAPVPAPTPQVEMRACPSCGKEQPANTKFCTDCGFKMQ
jgi:DNA repair exonuclease SbcCD ATPase subunit